MRPRIAYVTCQTIPEPDPDEQMLLDASIEFGFDAEYVGWEDQDANWSIFDAAILRSTWNYYLHEEDFRNWIEHVSKKTDLWNPPATILPNIHKQYLAQLAASGHPIVPTIWRCSGAKEPDVAQVLDQVGWKQIVIKPCVSAASYMTRCFSATELEDAQRFAEELLRTRDIMLQMYLPSVHEEGELSVVCIDGEISHGVVKRPRFHDGVEDVEETSTSPDTEARALTMRVLESIRTPWLYARVDLMRSPAGHWLLSELELLEPSLFFIQHPPAIAKFLKSLQERMRIKYARS